MRVLVLTFEFPPFAGGVATYTRTVARGLESLGCQVLVLAPDYPGQQTVDREGPFRTTRMPVGHGEKELWRFFPALTALRRALRQFRPHVALLTSDLAHGVGAIACSLERVVFVPVIHGSEVVKHFPATSLKRFVQSAGLRFAYSRAPRLLCVSRFTRDLVVAAGFPEARADVIHNGVAEELLDAPISQSRTDELRSRFGLRGRTVILTLARVVERKGQEQMIEAFPAILRRHPEVCYVIAGAGSNRSRLQALVRTRGVREHVVFTGEIPEADKMNLLDLSAVYVLPSHSDGERVEGLGISLLEAGARARPLIAGRHGGIPEIITHGIDGLLVDAIDPRQLARAALELLGDPARARALGEGAKKTVRTRFLAGRMARETRAQLEAAVARAHPSQGVG